ncbi:MAG: S8 family serine peptidase [Ignavibacteria bacterium]|nr:S8 family serine peptidase [Ignavibacteria bacterium]
MRKIIFAICVVGLTTFSISAQQKYMVYFKDKGIANQTSLQKTSQAYSEAVQSLSERSIQRRIKHRGAENFITFEDVPLYQPYITELENSGAKIWNKLKWFNAVSLFAEKEQIAEISSLPFVEKVEAVQILSYKKDKIEEQSPKSFEKTSLDNTALAYDYGSSLGQYALSKIPQVHAKGITGDSVVVGIFDSGFRWKLIESLVSRKVIAEYDFVFHDNNTANETGDVGGQDSHGTSIFSLVGGFKEGRIVAPAFNASFILAKTEYIGSETHVEEDNYAAALQWMDSIGVDITTSSLGYNEFDPSTFSYAYSDMNGKTTVVTKAVELAFTQFGISTFTSAGNDGNSAWHYIGAPADGFNVIAVGSVSNTNIKAGSSSFGPSYDGRIKPEIVTQGVLDYAASVSGTSTSAYGTVSGTSAAAPIAAGIGAQLLSVYPHLTNVQIRQILLATAGNASSPNNEIGYGLLSSLKAVAYPNLKKVDQTYSINKCFESENILAQTVLLHLINGTQTADLPMTLGQKGIFSSSIPSYGDGDVLQFYFTYSHSSQNIIREPANGKFFETTYGKLLVTSISDEVPESYNLKQNYPNPFNLATSITFFAVDSSPVELSIYDVLGKKVATLYNGIPKIGKNVEQWNGENNFGLVQASGIYFYVLRNENKIQAKKMVLLK